MSEKNIHSALIGRCKRNDRKAQVRIYELYYKAMYNTSLRIVNDSMIAEDIMQESFIDAFKKIQSYHGSGSFGSWLKAIVVNKSLDELKKRKPNIRFDDVEESDVHFDSVEYDDAYADHVFHKMETIQTVMEDLPDQYRIILSLYLLEGYDHQEISAILNISYNNVRTRYSRAKQRLIQDINLYEENYLRTIRN